MLRGYRCASQSVHGGRWSMSWCWLIANACCYGLLTRSVPLEILTIQVLFGTIWYEYILVYLWASLVSWCLTDAAHCWSQEATAEHTENVLKENPQMSLGAGLEEVHAHIHEIGPTAPKARTETNQCLTKKERERERERERDTHWKSHKGQWNLMNLGTSLPI